jgi:hypothetical protein
MFKKHVILKIVGIAVSMALLPGAILIVMIVVIKRYKDRRLLVK